MLARRSDAEKGGVGCRSGKWPEPDDRKKNADGKSYPQPMRTQRRLWRGGDGGGAEVCVLRGGGSDERERVPS